MDKKIELETLKGEVSCCTKCPELVANRTQTVFADGSYDADLMLVGEAPGYWEDQKGIPFVGDAGQLLTNILKACGFSRQDVYIANILKCNPPGNRNPTEQESNNCRIFLDKQIDIVKPKYLLLLGSIASKALLGDSVSSLRGRWHQYKGIPTLCTYHPSYVLREGDSAKREVGKDLRMLLNRMKS